MKNIKEIKEILMISKFMGFEKVETWYEDKGMLLPQHIYDNASGNGFDFDELLFDSSWNWLMPVVEKIESIGYKVAIEWTDTEISGFEYCTTFYSNDSKTHSVYESVVKFIEFYNEKKEV